MVIDKQLIEKKRKELQFRDPGIFEKAVYALNLLPFLLEFYPKLIFKGGTSLLLHQYPPVRLSIDVDILLPEKAKISLNEKLVAVVKRSGIFKSVEEDVRGGRIPMAHFKFFYDSHFSRIKQNVLLDVVFCENPYPKMVKKSLKEQELIVHDTDAMVAIPTVEGLFADKLIAISSKTLGLKLTEGRDMEFLKQIIDLDSLFNLVSSMDEIKKAFDAVAEQENVFRESRFTNEDVMADILDVAWKYSQWMLRGANSSFKEIVSINRGLVRLSNHLVRGVDSAALKVAFGKIAYILRMLRDKQVGEIIKDVDELLVQDKRFEQRYKILDGLKKSNYPAYFYWVLGVGRGNI